jgi:alpha-1,2-mannosyltransferase
MKVTTKLLLLVLATVSVACILYALGAGYMGIFPEVFMGKTSTDSSAYMDKAWIVVRSGRSLFPTLFFQQHVKYIYPTSSLLLAWLASGLGITLYALVRVLVLTSAILTLLVTGDIFLRVLPAQSENHGYRWKVRALIALLGLFFYPLVNGVQLGQIQTLLTFLFTLAVWLWLRGQKIGAAVCLAVACSFKPPLALFLVWGALRREWRFVCALFGTVLLVQVIAIWLFGWKNEWEYLPVLNYLSHHGEMLGENQSVNGFLQRLTRNGQNDLITDYVSYPPYNRIVYLGTLLSSLLLVAVGLLVPVWRRWRDPVGDFLFFGLLSTIASPIVWTHHYGVFYIGTVYLLAVFLRDERAIPATLAVCYVVLANLFHLLGRFYWVPSVNWVFSYGLYAGVGIILIFLWKYERYGLGKLK